VKAGESLTYFPHRDEQDGWDNTLKDFRLLFRRVSDLIRLDPLYPCTILRNCINFLKSILENPFLTGMERIKGIKP